MAAPTPPRPSNPNVIATLGEGIYKDKYKSEYEANHFGKFVAVNVTTQDATIGDNPDEALQQAKKADPAGLFHLIRIGFPSAFQVSYAANNSPDWVFG